MKKRDFIFGAAASAVGLGCKAQAGLDLLLLDGDVNSGTPVGLTDADLLALPQKEFETRTQWTNGLRRFSGPLLVDLLHRYSAGPGELQLTATNAYSVTVSRDLVTAQGPIIANRIDGEPFSLREKGPLWLVYNYDQGPAFRTEVVFAASVWQLRQITVLIG